MDIYTAETRQGTNIFSDGLTARDLHAVFSDIKKAFTLEGVTVHVATHASGDYLGILYRRVFGQLWELESHAGSREPDCRLLDQGGIEDAIISGQLPKNWDHEAYQRNGLPEEDRNRSLIRFYGQNVEGEVSYENEVALRRLIAAGVEACTGLTLAALAYVHGDTLAPSVGASSAEVLSYAAIGLGAILGADGVRRGLSSRRRHIRITLKTNVDLETREDLKALFPSLRKLNTGPEGQSLGVPSV